MSARGIQRLDSLLREVISGSALAPGLARQGILEDWSEIVGPQIAAHSRAASLNDGVLMVHVDASVWAQELSMLTPEIRDSFNRRLGSSIVREIRFRSGKA